MDQEIIFGNYVARQHIKTDGVIEIYAGVDASGTTRVTIKALPAEYAGNPEVVRRFFWEATVAERLKGLPSVVTLVAKGTGADGSPYYVLPYHETTLASLLPKADRFPLQDRLRIARNVIEGLGSCHSRGVLHRNLKPAAVCIDLKTRAAVVSEFGLAKVGQQDMFGAEERTFDDAQYSSPEQGELKPADERSDVYAAGVLLYELFSGHKPFPGETTDAIQLQKLKQGPAPLRSVNPEVSAAVDAVVMKALSRVPADRFPNGGELLTSLDRALSPTATPAPPPPAAPAAAGRARPPAARRPPISLDLDEDREETARPKTHHLDLGEKTDAFSRQLLGQKETHHVRQTVLIIAGILLVVGVVVGLFIKSSMDSRAEQEAAKAREHEAFEAAKRQKAQEEKMATMQTEADELQKAGDYAAALAKHDEVLAMDAANAISKERKDLIGKRKEIIKGMVLVAGGRFKMGLEPDVVKDLQKKVGAKKDQLDACAATDKYVDAFFIDLREVMNAEYKQFLDANPGVKAPAATKPDDEEFAWKNGTFPEGKGDSPVVLVTWEDANAYAKWAGKRLPNGVEWEKAARGQEQRFLWPWGNTWDKSKCNTASSGKDNIEPAGSHLDGASPYGVLDMVGNASEWTSDIYEDGKKKSAGIAGASWLDEDSVTPAALKFSEDVTSRRPTVGFRCAMTP